MNNRFTYGLLNPPGGRHGRRGRDPFVMIMLFQLIQRIMELPNKPPVTLAAMAFQFLLYWGLELLPPDFRRFVPSVKGGCINPRLILKGGQWSRMLWSNFLHVDERHIVYNMSSFLWKGVQLERAYGTLGFAALLGEMVFLSSMIELGAAWWLGTSFREYRYMLDGCSVGFSGVLFGLKVILNHASPGMGNIMGISLPTKYLCWAELFLASYLNPQASFMGHLAGIAAGFLHVHGVEPLLRSYMAGGHNGFGAGSGAGFGAGRRDEDGVLRAQARQYFSSGGRLGGQQQQQGAAQGAAGAGGTATAGHSSSSNNGAGGSGSGSAVPPRPAAPVRPTTAGTAQAQAQGGPSAAGRGVAGGSGGGGGGGASASGAAASAGAAALSHQQPQPSPQQQHAPAWASGRAHVLGGDGVSSAAADAGARAGASAGAGGSGASARAGNANGGNANHGNNGAGNNNNSRATESEAEVLTAPVGVSAEELRRRRLARFG